MNVLLIALLLSPVFSQDFFDYNSCRRNNPNRTSYERLNCDRYHAEITWNRDPSNTRYTRHKRSREEMTTDINDKSLEDEFIKLYSSYYSDRAGADRLIIRIRAIKWKDEVKDVHSFMLILWRVNELMKLMSVLEPDQTENILLTHEIIFSNMFHWNIINMDYIIYLFFSIYQDLIKKIEQDNAVMMDRIKETVTSYYTLIKNNQAWKQYDLDYYFYVMFNRHLQIPLMIETEKITKESIIPFNQSITFGNIKIMVWSQMKLDEDYVRNTLSTIYHRFSMYFYPLVEKSIKPDLNINFHIFNNKSEYRKHAAFFRFATNNGGITYIEKERSYNTYCYMHKGYVLNFGHEFVHSLIFFYFKDSSKFTDFIHEGISEAIGQQPVDIRDIEEMRYININDSISSNYETSTSPYTNGFIVFNYLLRTNLLSVLEPYNEEAFYNLVESNRHEYITHKNRFIQTYREPKSIVNQTYVFRKYYPGDLLLIIDNTYFEIVNGHVYKYHQDRNKKYSVLDSGNNDFHYLITFVMKTAVKKIENYMTFFPQIYKMKEHIHIRRKQADKSLDDIFDSFFLIGNELDYKFANIGGRHTFTTIKDLIYHKLNVKAYKDIVVPNMKLSRIECKLIYDLNSAKIIDLISLRSFPSHKSLDINNRSISALFSSLFPLYIFNDKQFVSILRNTTSSSYELKRRPVAVNTKNKNINEVINMLQLAIKKLYYIGV